MDELEEKKKAYYALRNEIQALEEKKRAEELWPEWKDLKGTYWKFRNSYSCPQAESDYWWMYRKITDIRPDGKMDTLQFQIDKDGKLTIEDEKDNSWLRRSMDWVPSTEAEWKEAFLKVEEIVGKIRS